MGRKSKSQEPRPDWAARLVAARQARGLSQTKLAAELNLSQSAYSEYETGLRPPPPRMLKKIAMALAIPVNEILPPDIKGLAQGQEEFDPQEPAEVAFGSFAASFLRAVHQMAGDEVPAATILTQARRIWRFAGGSDDAPADLDRLAAGMEMMLDTYRTLTASRRGGGPEKPVDVTG